MKRKFLLAALFLSFSFSAKANVVVEGKTETSDVRTQPMTCNHGFAPLLVSTFTGPTGAAYYYVGDFKTMQLRQINLGYMIASWIAAEHFQNRVGDIFFGIQTFFAASMMTGLFVYDFMYFASCAFSSAGDSLVLDTQH